MYLCIYVFIYINTSLVIKLVTDHHQSINEHFYSGIFSAIGLAKLFKIKLE